MDKGRERDTLPSAASGGGIREIRQKRDSISPYRARHITLAHPVATQQLQGSSAGLQTSVTDKNLHVCVRASSAHHVCVRVLVYALAED